MGNPVQNNPLRTRADVERAAVQLLEPLLPLFSPGCARLPLGDTGATYPAAVAQMEAYARPLWAMVPMLAGNCQGALPLWEKWRQGLINGVDPAHPEYWGQVADHDQRLVEMAKAGHRHGLAPGPYAEFPRPSKPVPLADQINDTICPRTTGPFSGCW